MRRERQGGVDENVRFGCWKRGDLGSRRGGAGETNVHLTGWIWKKKIGLGGGELLSRHVCIVDSLVCFR